MDSANTRKDGGVGGNIPPRGRSAEEPDAGEGNTVVDVPNKGKESVGKNSQEGGWQVCTRRRRDGRASVSLKPWGSSVYSPKADWSSGKDCAPSNPCSWISSPNAGWSSGKKDCAPLEPWGSSISSPKAGGSSGKDCVPSNPGNLRFLHQMLVGLLVTIVLHRTLGNLRFLHQKLARLLVRIVLHWNLGVLQFLHQMLVGLVETRVSKTVRIGLLAEVILSRNHRTWLQLRLYLRLCHMAGSAQQGLVHLVLNRR
ncbi:unnamed protein product [Musa textilis]